MPKLNPADHPVITHGFLEQILKKYDIRSFVYELPASGIANTTLLISSGGRKAVLRIYQRGSKSLQAVKLELAFMEMLGHEGVPVPKVQNDTANRQVGQIVADGYKWLYILMDFVPGVHADEYTPVLLRNLARTQARMHVLGATFSPENHQPNRSPTKLVETYNTRINREEVNNTAIREFLDRARDFTVTLPATLPLGYNHLDYDVDNVLVKHDEITAVLDFDDLEYTPIAMCLGYTLWDVLDETGDTEQVRTYLAEYERLRPLGGEEINWLQSVMMFRNYVIGVVDFQFYGNKSRRIDRCIALEGIISDLNTKDLTPAGT